MELDEIERPKEDNQTTSLQFWELAKLVSPQSKVLLTCRTTYFRHHNEEGSTLLRAKRPFALVAGDQIVNLQNRQGFEIVHLLEFTEEDVQTVLTRRLSSGWQEAYWQIHAVSNLQELSCRPVLLEIIIDTLPHIRNVGHLDLSTLYEIYVTALVDRRWSNGVDHLSSRPRLLFVQELALTMYKSRRSSVPFTEISAMIPNHFALNNAF